MQEFPSARRDEEGVSDEDRDNDNQEQELGTYFTYTPSIAWAWRGKDEDEAVHRERGHEDLGTGYIDDEVLVGIGVDDVAQALVKVRVDGVLACMRICPSA